MSNEINKRQYIEEILKNMEKNEIIMRKYEMDIFREERQHHFELEKIKIRGDCELKIEVEKTKQEQEKTKQLEIKFKMRDE